MLCWKYNYAHNVTRIYVLPFPHAVDPTTDTTSECREAVIGGALGAAVALLLAYSIVTTIVIIAMRRRDYTHKTEVPIYKNVG